MKQAASKTTNSLSGNTTTPVLGVIGMDVLNTAWRIAVPVLVAAILGIIADRHFGTAPWFTLPAVVVGLVIAGLLVKQQLAILEKEGR